MHLCAECSQSPLFLVGRGLLHHLHYQSMQAAARRSSLRRCCCHLQSQLIQEPPSACKLLACTELGGSRWPASYEHTFLGTWEPSLRCLLCCSLCHHSCACLHAFCTARCGKCQALFWGVHLEARPQPVPCMLWTKLRFIPTLSSSLSLSASYDATSKAEDPDEAAEAGRGPLAGAELAGGGAISGLPLLLPGPARAGPTEEAPGACRCMILCSPRTRSTASCYVEVIEVMPRHCVAGMEMDPSCPPASETHASQCWHLNQAAWVYAGPLLWPQGGGQWQSELPRRPLARMSW